MNRLCLIVYWKHLVTFIETKISLCWWRQYIFYLCGAPVKALADIDSPKWRQFLFFANLASTQPVTLWHTKGKPHWLKPVTNLYSTLYSPGVAGVRVTWTSKIQSEILCNCKNDFFSFFFQISTQMPENMWTSKNHRYVALCLKKQEQLGCVKRRSALPSVKVRIYLLIL